MMFKKLWRKCLSVMISLAMAFTLLPAFSTTAYAGNTYTGNITSGGKMQTLYTGYTYTVPYTMSVTDLRVAGNSTVALYIPSGVVLYCYGSSGSGSSPGRAGLYLPSSSSLVITGGGVLYAYGGCSGTALGGGSGTSANSSYTGAGGSGGAGAGAGIGTDGGSGGVGGGGGSNYSYGPYSTGCYNGHNGMNGFNGTASETMGTLYVLGTVTVNSYAGTTYTSSGGSGGYGSAYQDYTSIYGWYLGAAGGAGGGGGGYAQSANALGSGGAGGGGGGGGAGGALGYSGYSNCAFFCGGGGGGGGAGYGYGGYGESIDIVSSSPYKYGGWSGNNATSALGYGGGGAAVNITQTGRILIGGSGGNGGSRGTMGGSGTVYKAGTAYCARNNGTVSNHSAVNYTLNLDRQNGSGGTASATAVYGTTIPNISVPSRSQYAFMGYYTSANGGGTRYYNQQGYGQVLWTETTNRTLYAYWVQNQFNVNLNEQGGSGGTTFFITQNTDGTLPASITIPTRAHYTFGGYYKETNGGGTQYYNADGTRTADNKITGNSTIYAKWTQSQWTVGFDQNGGSGGAQDTWSGTGGVLAGSVTVPVKTGYTFLGYFNAQSGGTQYYVPSGTRCYGSNIAAPLKLYAQWSVASYTITYEGIEGADISGQPTGRAYTDAAIVPDPTKAEYTFMGWSINGSSGRYKNLTIAANTYPENITLKAYWLKASDTDVTVDASVNGVVANPEDVKQQLNSVFDTTVDDVEKGITTDEINTAASIKIVLEVKADSNSTNQELIDSTAPGSSLVFYDITAKKLVTDTDETITTTVLKEIPSHIDVVIPLTGDLANQSSYAVYRVHEGSVEMLTADVSSSGEYYSVEEYNGTLSVVIRTRKFSTYGIVGSTTEVVPGTTDTGKGFDVQGRVIEREPGLVYKVDVSWGAMKFEFTTANRWDPDQHVYEDGNANGWVQTGFDGTNNKISTMNHSNGDVIVNYAITDKTLTGVEMGLHSNNGTGYAEADNHVLVAAPEGSTDDELTTFDAYLWLNGTPDAAWITGNKTNYVKVAILLVTVAPQTT